MNETVSRFLRDETGQDLIEYALLAVFIGIVGVVTWQAIGSGISNDYTGWDAGVQYLSGCTPNPGGGGC